MPRIQQLPPEVFTKIAAGEVIERPASVVKELLENSVDAGATRLDVEISQGGTDLIRVVDNGCGIPSEDLVLVFASHATSKLQLADDLFRVRTLGFRGEALASVGSVAQVTLQSRPTGETTGAEITCHGGQLGPVRPWNGAAGTRVEVRHLFFNTPVRRKFLRSPATELGHVSEAVTRLALAFPTLQINLVHNDRSVFEIPGSAGLLERLGLFFGHDVTDKLLPLEASAGPARLSGYLADPACDRGNPRMQYLFVNGRCVRDRALGHALQEAYRGLIMTGRYCVAFLFLELPPDHVDVNVHPAKAEVRFRDAQALYHLVLTAVRERLRAADLTAALESGPGFQHLRLSPAPEVNGVEALTRDFARAAEMLPLPTQTPAPPPPPLAPPHSPATSSPAASRAPPPGSPAEPLQASPPLKALQVHESYLVAETPEGMLVIDQHALHERILYEQWKARLREGRLETQRLLVPEPVDLPPEQAACAIENQEVLRRLGLEVQEFGGGTILVTSYPALSSKALPEQLLRAAVEHLIGVDRPPTPEQLLDDLLRLMACRSAIKAGDHLGPEEIAALIAHRHLADHTHHCPHGRPTALLLSKQELDRQFKRT